MDTLNMMMLKPLKSMESILFKYYMISLKESLLPLIRWVYGGAILFVDVKYVDVKSIESIMPLMVSIEAFDLGTYA